MADGKPSREEAFSLLTEYNKSEGLIKHALAVEGVMRYFARKRGEDEEKWGVIGFCLLYTSPSPRDLSTSRMPSSA